MLGIHVRQIERIIAHSNVNLFSYQTWMNKAEADPWKEEGSLAGSYNTIFKHTVSDPSGAEISHVFGESFISDAYLVVKDGNHSPWWYLFDLANWNGTDTLYLSGFWPNGGAISYVGLYGKASVPEPSTVLLLGLGLVGLAGIGRKKLKKMICA